MAKVAKPHKIPTMMTTPAMDAMYFHSARQALSKAAKYTPHIERAERKVESLQSKIDALSRSPEGDEDREVAWRNDSKLEPLYIQMEGAEYLLGEAYGPMLQSLATAHILCAASAEAHINLQAHP